MTFASSVVLMADKLARLRDLLDEWERGGGADRQEWDLDDIRAILDAGGADDNVINGCNHGSNYMDGDNWHCLVCPHVWPVADDPEGWGLNEPQPDDNGRLARRWHDLSDHAADGTPFGGGVCNCEALAPRLRVLLAEYGQTDA